MKGWQRYLSIEEDFSKARQYVPYTLIGTTYSEFSTRQVILLGAEIEAALKMICKNVEPNSERGCIAHYKNVILSHFPRIVNWKCIIKTEEIYFKPFQNWDKDMLKWWNVYTEIKHNIIDKTATYEVALEMLAAYELLLLLVEASDPEREKYTDTGSGGTVWNELSNDGKVKRYTCIDFPILLVPDIKFGIGDGINGIPGIAFYPEDVIEMVK